MPRWSVAADTPSAGGKRHGCVQHVLRRALPAGVGVVERTCPVQAELAAAVPVVGPDRASVVANELAVGGTPALPVEIVEVAHEYALELRAVPVAASCAVLSGLEQDAVPRARRQGGQRVQRSVGDRLALPEITGVAGDLIQRGEPAEDDSLVIGPRLATVVLAGIVEPVVNQAGSADQAVGAEPVPLSSRPVEVLATAGTTLMQPCCECEEQFIGDGVLVRALGVKAQATT